MSYEKPQPPQYQGETDKGKNPYEPPPPPQPCPDPCDEKPPWGPPEIRPECCSHNPCCADEEGRCCTWDSVEDPCVKAASADCGLNWTKITCGCESSNKDCDCEEWDCGCYPQGTCVPCKPCEGIIPDPGDGGGGCDDPGRDDCTSDDLRKQLDALNHCISSQQNEKAKLEADIKARNERAAALNDLITKFDGIIKAYKDQRHKLVCREDCLKGFHRDITTVFSKYSPSYLGDLTKYINGQLCLLEQEKCCQQNLEGKLSKVTKLIWEQQQADKEKQKADKALEIVMDLPKWLDDQFKVLEALKDQIAQALNDDDPQKQKWAFYLFYWKFVPKLCKCFPFPFCCEEKDETQPEPKTDGAGGSEQTPGQYGDKSDQTPQQQSGTPEPGSQQYQNGEPPKPNHLGCKPGDWHPSAITEETLRNLICCAWDYARRQKQDLQDATDRVTDATNNLTFIKTKVEADVKSLDDRIQSGLNKVAKSAPTGR